MSKYRIYDNEGAFTGAVLTGNIYPEDIEAGQLYVEADESLVNPRLDITDPQNMFEVEMVNIPYTLDVTTITANGVDVATFTGLPTGTTLSCKDSEWSEVSGSAPFGTDLAGDYIIVLSHPIYLTTEVTITAI